MTTETIKLLDKDGVSDILDRLEGREENTQTAMDLLFVALLTCSAVGVEHESIYEVIPQQLKLANDFWSQMNDTDS